MSHKNEIRSSASKGMVKQQERNKKFRQFDNKGNGLARAIHAATKKYERHLAVTP